MKDIYERLTKLSLEIHHFFLAHGKNDHELSLPMIRMSLTETWKKEQAEKLELAEKLAKEDTIGNLILCSLLWPSAILNALINSDEICKPNHKFEEWPATLGTGIQIIYLFLWLISVRFPPELQVHGYLSWLLLMIPINGVWVHWYSNHHAKKHPIMINTQFQDRLNSLENHDGMTQAVREYLAPISERYTDELEKIKNDIRQESSDSANNQDIQIALLIIEIQTQIETIQTFLVDGLQQAHESGKVRPGSYQPSVDRHS